MAYLFFYDILVQGVLFSDNAKRFLIRSPLFSLWVLQNGGSALSTYRAGGWIALTDAFPYLLPVKVISFSPPDAGDALAVPPRSITFFVFPRPLQGLFSLAWTQVGFVIASFAVAGRRPFYTPPG